jgi:predicted phosphodiesterase
MKQHLALTIALCGALNSWPAPAAAAPLHAWTFEVDAAHEGHLHPTRGGLDARLQGRPEFVTDAHGEALLLDGLHDQLIVLDDWVDAPQRLPKRAVTASAWVMIHTPTRWGGIVGCLQDNGGFEKGWLLGYDNDSFYFGISSIGADDGDGKLTYLDGATKLEAGKWYHVAGVYDGETMRLYVDGELDAESDEQSGDILYPPHAPLTLGVYLDDNERYPLHGRLREVTIHDSPLSAVRVQAEFARQSQLTDLAAVEDTRLRMLVDPYLQFATPDSMTVMWETTRPCTSLVEYGLKTPLTKTAELAGAREVHEVHLAGLEPNTKYFYRVKSTDDLGQGLTSDVYSFQTAVNDATPFAFAVIADTQAQGPVVNAIAEQAWSTRPNFAIVAGDLVSTGSNKSHWTAHFFPNMHPLISRVPFYPVLGNHEGNAEWYYRYMSLPQPEYFYDFRYGNAHFFMIDSNKPLGSNSEQHAWLAERLAASEATWKIVVHHHPPYTSDENDYGNTWAGDSAYGDRNVRQLASIYERHGVDLVFNGHIHVYERTWPIRDGRVVQEGGVIYVTAGGGGGGLENFAPTKTWFSNTVRRSHHFCYLAVNGGRLEFKAFDLEGRLFDSMVLTKPEATTLSSGQ